MRVTTIKRKIEENIKTLSAGLRKRPSFIIIGTQRGGTTSLFEYLKRHPQIVLPNQKELHFFDLNYGKNLRWYRSHFPPLLKKRKAITGEATPYYLFHPLAAKRIWKMNQDMKLIILLRNPTDRAYSHYYHEVEMGHENLTFEKALEKEKERLQGTYENANKKINDKFNHQHFSYISRGIYEIQIQRLFKYFSRENILIMQSEDFFHNPAKSINEVTRFLSLKPFKLTRYPTHNKNKKPPLKSKTKKKLDNIFKPHNEKLYELLNTKFNWNND